jgi:WD40 repeat protein
MKAFGACLILLFCLGCDDQSGPPQGSTFTVPTAQADSGLPSAVQAHHESNVTALAFSPDGRLLTTNGTVRLWDVRSGQEITGGVPFRSVAPERYDSRNIDNMPQVGPDNFKILQDQIDALEQRIRKLEQERAAKP